MKFIVFVLLASLALGSLSANDAQAAPMRVWADLFASAVSRPAGDFFHALTLQVKCNAAQASGFDVGGLVDQLAPNGSAVDTDPDEGALKRRDWLSDLAASPPDAAFAGDSLGPRLGRSAALVSGLTGKLVAVSGGRGRALASFLSGDAEDRAAPVRKADDNTSGTPPNAFVPEEQGDHDGPPISLVPEPGVMALVGLGLAVAGVRRRAKAACRRS